MAALVYQPQPLQVEQLLAEPPIRRGVPKRRDEEVEAIAMDGAMRHECRRGWTPTDVSRFGLHGMSQLLLRASLC
jgi:hypothetical protein